jgi:hypothetical protein
MLRHLGLIAVSTCIVVSVGCEGPTGPGGPLPTVTVEFSGRVVNADTEDPVGNVRISVDDSGVYGGTLSATSGGDGTFTLRLTLPPSWVVVKLKLLGPGYDERFWSFKPNTAGTPAEIRMYRALVIRPGESIEVRVDQGAHHWCGSFFQDTCRRVQVEGSSGEAVELEILSHDASKFMGLTADEFSDEFVPRLMVAPPAVAYVNGVGTARLTARR